MTDEWRKYCDIHKLWHGPCGVETNRDDCVKGTCDHREHQQGTVIQ